MHHDNELMYVCSTRNFTDLSTIVNKSVKHVVNKKFLSLYVKGNDMCLFQFYTQWHSRYCSALTGGQSDGQIDLSGTWIIHYSVYNLQDVMFSRIVWLPFGSVWIYNHIIYIMEGINFSLKVAILALVALSGHTGTALQFHCDTPDEWLGTKNLIIG